MNFRKIILTVVTIFVTSSIMAQTDADYQKVISQFQAFYNAQQTDSIVNMLSDKVKSAMPADKMAQMLDKLFVQLGDMKSFEYTNTRDAFRFYKTEFTKGTLSLVVALNHEDKMETFRFLPYKQDNATAKHDTSNFVLKTAAGSIYGTLVKPSATGKIPVVLIIPGSGPTDRNGNNIPALHTDTYRLLADSLQKKGIASVRYDKRGIGESAADVKNEEGLTFDDMVNDAAGFVKMLKEDARFSKVIILGHSEGSLIGMLAAQKEAVAGYISVAGIGEPADKIIETQIANQSKSLAAKATIILDSLKNGYTVSDVPTELDEIFRTSVQPYLRAWLQYDAAKEIKKVKEPILIVQGTTDLQVGIQEAKKLKEANPKAALKIIPGMNHILKNAPEEKKKNLATYTDPALPLCPGLIPAINKFILVLK